jgi:hypothetical protein
VPIGERLVNIARPVVALADETAVPARTTANTAAHKNFLIRYLHIVLRRGCSPSQRGTRHHAVVISQYHYGGLEPERHNQAVWQVK